MPKRIKKSVALYLRVSTSEQTTRNQRRQLEAVAKRRSLTDLLEFLKDLHAKRVDLFLHQQDLDTSTHSLKSASGKREENRALVARAGC